MVVFSNRRLGAGVQLVVPDEVARTMLAAIASAARPFARVRWEHDLVRWLEDRKASSALDVGEIAWSPEYFEAQRRFVLEAIERARDGADGADNAATLERWAQMIEAHPRDSVQFGRLWQWQANA